MGVGPEGTARSSPILCHLTLSKDDRYRLRQGFPSITYPPLPITHKERAMSFWHLLKVVRSRALMILGVVLITLLVVWIAAPRPKNLFEASTYMKPTEQVMQGGATTTRDDNEAQRPDRGVMLSNLIILAQGGDVYNRALDFLALPVERQKKEEPGLPAYKQLSRVEVSKGQVLTFADWANILEVLPVQNQSVGDRGTTTDVIRVSVKLADPDIAPFLANAVGHAFSQEFQEKSQEDSRKYEKFLSTSLDSAKGDLRRLQDQIAAFKEQHNVVSVDSETQLTAQALQEVDTERNEAEGAVRQARAALTDVEAQLKTQPLVEAQVLPGDMNPAVQKLKTQLDEEEANFRLLATRYTPSHQTYKLAQARIADLKRRIAAESKNYSPPSINEIHKQLVQKKSDALYALATAQAKLAATNANAGRAHAKMLNLSVAEPKLAELMTDRAQVENNYKTISDKLTQARIAEEEFTRTGSISALDWSREANPLPTGPSLPALLLYGLALSLIVGVVFAVWLDSIDTRMRNAADVEKLLELPVLGLTPQLTGRDGMLPKLTHMYPLSPMAESYRILRTNILFELRDQPFRTLMVATGRPGQGGTTSICNLAIALAQIGKRIILIDADMRRPSLHKFFGVSNESGLSTLLQGRGNVTEAFRKTGIDNLIVLPAGPQPMNPSELLGSERMHEIVQRLEEHCDLVLFDTPSTVVFSDGPMLASSDRRRDYGRIGQPVTQGHGSADSGSLEESQGQYTRGSGEPDAAGCGRQLLLLLALLRGFRAQGARHGNWAAAGLRQR